MVHAVDTAWPCFTLDVDLTCCDQQKGQLQRREGHNSAIDDSVKGRLRRRSGRVGVTRWLLGSLSVAKSWSVVRASQGYNDAAMFGHRVCAVVKAVALGDAANAAARRMEVAVRSTWGADAIFSPGQGYGQMTEDFESLFKDFVASGFEGSKSLGIDGHDSCSWYVFAPSLHVYINIPAIESVLLHVASDAPERGADASDPNLGRRSVLDAGFRLRGSRVRQLPPDRIAEAERIALAPVVLSRRLLESCWGDGVAVDSFAKCVWDGIDVPVGNAVDSVGGIQWKTVDPFGYHSFAHRDPSSCMLAVLQVRGSVHLSYIHDQVQRSGGMRQCDGIFKRAMASSTPAYPSSIAAESDGAYLKLEGPLCILVTVDLHRDASNEDVQHVGSMARAAHKTWATNSTIFLLPAVEESPAGLHDEFAGILVSKLPVGINGDGGPSDNSMFFKSIHEWKHALTFLTLENSSCDWTLKVPVYSYVNAPAIEQRLACFNASESWYLGATTAAYSHGLEPFMFSSEKTGGILSKGAYANVSWWVDICLQQWTSVQPPAGASDFLSDYAFALCLSDLGPLKAQNYADINASFILTDRPAQTLIAFEEHPDTVKQCLLVVSKLGDSAALRRVHDRIVWSGWHKSTPCIGESQTGKYVISDLYGNKSPYYDERIRLALYYCKAPEMLALEEELAAKLDGVDPRSGGGALNATLSERAITRRQLCIFVPSSSRKEKFIKAAEAAWQEWGTPDTYFVSPTRLSALLDRQTFISDLDIDTDYAHLPVRTFRLFEALGRPEWADACEWFMKADADSFMNVPLIRERLKCFDPNEFWFLGVPQVAHGTSGPLRRFASGGAGYIVSRALLPKVAFWSPFCLLQLLQHTGGTGMEDVSFAICLWRWGHISVVSYIDPETEAIHSEAAFNRTLITIPRQMGMANVSENPGAAAAKHVDAAPQLPSISPCTFVIHSIQPEEVWSGFPSCGRIWNRHGQRSPARPMLAVASFSARRMLSDCAAFAMLCLRLMMTSSAEKRGKMALPSACIVTESSKRSSHAVARWLEHCEP